MENKRDLSTFEDILNDRRRSSDMVWVSRKWDPAVAYIQPSKTSATQIKHSVLGSYRIQYIINEISEEQNISKKELYRKVKEILDEVGYNREVPVLRWLGLFTAKILKKLCSGILVNETSLLAVKAQMGKNPVLFIPSHRSYGDFILMSYICFHYEMDIPRIAAGMDFHSMVIMGKILRDSCAFFMRRSFSNDKLYSATFSQYVQTLITEGDAAIEFFIEGTRSRTAKSLMPKFGFLSMALMPFFTGQVPDITIVPVTFSYDRTLEEVLFAYELLGVPKPKESTSGFFKALKILNENYGYVYVDFGQPISVKEYFGNNVDRSLHNNGPIQLQDLTSHESKLIVDLAHTIIKVQQDLSVITCFNLIALILNNFILNGSVNISLNDVMNEVVWLKTIFQNLGALVNVSADVEFSCVEAIDLHKSLVHMSRDTGEIKLLHVHLSNSTVDPKKLKGYPLSFNTMSRSVPMVILQHYVNPCVRYLVNMSFIVVALNLFQNSASILKDELYKKFHFLRTVFSHEFVFHHKHELKDFEDTLRHCQEEKILNTINSTNVSLGDNKKLNNLLSNTFVPFLSGYVVISKVLNQVAQQYHSENDILKFCQSVVETRLRDGDVPHPYALSLDLFSNALQAFSSMQCISKSKRNGQTQYRIQENSMKNVESELTEMFEALKVKNHDNSSELYLHLQGKL